jgi:hypothetical protein
MPAVTGAMYLLSVGSPLALFEAALSLLYAKVPARPALISDTVRPLAPFLNEPLR